MANSRTRAGNIQSKSGAFCTTRKYGNAKNTHQKKQKTNANQSDKQKLHIDGKMQMVLIKELLKAKSVTI